MELLGCEYLDADGSLNFRQGDDAYVLVSPHTGEQAWAIYGLTSPLGLRPVAVAIGVEPVSAAEHQEPELPLQYWCAVSNYTRYCWEWWGPFSESAVIALNSESRRDRYVSATDQLFIAVLAVASPALISQANPTGSVAACIDNIEITHRNVDDLDYYSTRPHYPAITSAKAVASEPPATELNWEHIADSASLDNEATRYYIYRKGPGDASKLLLGTLDAPDTLYVDPVNNCEQIGSLIAGLHYNYFLEAANSAGTTPTDSIRLQVPPQIPGQHQLVITSYLVRIENASGGGKPNGDLFGSLATTGGIQANSDTFLELHSINGEFDGLAFSGRLTHTWPPAFSSAIYSSAIAAARDSLQWYSQNSDDSNSRRCSDWLLLGSGSFPITGNPGGAAIFPDYRPVSLGGSSAGRLTTYLPPSCDGDYIESNEFKVHVVYAIEYSIDLDIQKDPLAPELLDYRTSNGATTNHLYIDRSTDLVINFSWGSEGAPLSPETTSLELYRIPASCKSSDLVSEFQFVPDNPAVSQFEIIQNLENTAIHCLVPNESLIESAEYGFRFNASGRWSTINLPGTTLEACKSGSSGTAVFPAQCFPSTDTLQVYCVEPRIRRNPSVLYQYETGAVVPVDLISYIDILKLKGSEFKVTYNDGLYPCIAIIEGNNPDLIDNWDDCIPGVFTIEQNPNKLWVDITVLTPVGNPEDPILTYSYCVFNEDGSKAGCGTFAVAPTDPPAVKPHGVAWGVNAFNRGDRLLDERDYSQHSVNANSVTWDSPTPDVLWFEVSDGWMLDPQQNATGVYPVPEAADTENMIIAVRESQTSEACYFSTAMRAVILSQQSTYLLIHALTPADFENPLDPEWPGILSPEHEYTLSLDDPRWPGLEYEFSDDLTISGSNPNE